MEKTWKRVILFAVLILSLLVIIRCTRKDDTLHPVSVPDNVASVSVSLSGGGTKLAATLQYTDPDKINQILAYLSSVELRGDPINPFSYSGWASDGIGLYATDGSLIAGYSICYFTFMRSEGDWYAIDSPEYEYFWSLINELEPDVLTEY